MSGLLERIARRRRASAISRLAPPLASPLPAQPGHPSPEIKIAARTVTGTTAGKADEANNGAVNGAVNGSPAGPKANHGAGNGNVAVLDRKTSLKPPNGSAVIADHEVAPPPPWLDIATQDLGLSPVATETPSAPETDAENPTALAEGPTANGADALDPQRAGLLERARIRRRVLYLRALRELYMRDLGGFMLELHRFETERPELVRAKLEGASAVDAELRELEQRLAQASGLGEVRLPGVGGACAGCGAIHGSSDRYCAGCGQPLRRTVAVRPPGGAESPDVLPDEA